MTNHLELWDKVRRVPQEHLKPFKRTGGFSGTAIKPMWTVQTMTETFGPCGQGWGIDAPSFQIVAGDNRETLVYCTVSVWHGSPEKKIFGVGGDRVVAHIKANEKYNTPERWQNDDEAFKKAFTDAVGNALKFLGVGADIHMGLWDGNKYVDETPDKPAPKAMPKTEARPEYTRMSANIKTINDTGTIEDLRLFYKNNVKTIESFDQGWQQQIMKEFDDAVASLKAKAA
jgi:hypothetical protein